MATTVKELIVKIKAQTDRDKIKKMDDAFIKATQSVKAFKKETVKTESKLQILSRTITRVATRANAAKFGRAMAAGLAVAATAAIGGAVAMQRFGESLAKVGDNLAKQAKQLGINVQELQKLRFAAELSGIGNQELNSSLRIFTKGVEDARQKGTGPFQDAIDEMGLSMIDFINIPTEERVKVIADAMADIEEPTRRSALAMQLFGSRTGGKLLPLLEGGRGAIESVGNELEGLGSLMSNELLASSEDLIDQISRQKQAFQGLKNEIFTAAAPAFRRVTTFVTEYIKANRELLGQNIAAFFKQLGQLVETVLPIMQSFLNVTVKIIDAFGGMGGAAVAAAAGFTAIKIGAAGALGPIGGIILGLTAAIPLAMRLGSAIGDILTRLDTSATRRTGDIGTTRLLKEQQNLGKTAAGRTILIARRQAKVQRDKSLNAFAQLRGQAEREIVDGREITDTQLLARRDFADTETKNLEFRQQRLQNLHRKQLVTIEAQEKNEEEKAEQTRKEKAQLELSRLAGNRRRTVDEDIRLDELREQLNIGKDLVAISRRAAEKAAPSVEELIKSVVTTQGGITALRNPALGTNIFNVNASASFDQDIVVTIPNLPEGSTIEDLKRAIGEAMQDVNRVAFEHQKSVIVA